MYCYIIHSCKTRIQRLCFLFNKYLLKNKFLIYCIFIFCFASNINLSAQQKWSLGLHTYMCNYQGDLVEQVLALKETKLGIGVNVRYQWRPKIALHADIQVLTLSGNDNNSELLAARNCSFRSSVGIASLNVEFQPFGRRRFDALGYHIYNASPYVRAGIGAVGFKTTVQGLDNKSQDWDVKPSFPTPALIGGIGYNWDINERINIAVEGNTMLVNTDYLDGISKSGRPNNRDWIVTGGITIQYWLGRAPEKRIKPNPMDVK